jgi:hypothetical protein
MSVELVIERHDINLGPIARQPLDLPPHYSRVKTIALFAHNLAFVLTRYITHCNIRIKLYNQLLSVVQVSQV